LKNFDLKFTYHLGEDICKVLQTSFHQVPYSENPFIIYKIEPYIFEVLAYICNNSVVRHSQEVVAFAPSRHSKEILL
jgi:hypothetical protein